MFGRDKKLRELINAQQNFHRAVHRIWKIMPDDDGTKFMLAVADPDPIIDWETGLELRDPCPKHPNQILGSWPIREDGQIHLKCRECNW